MPSAPSGLNSSTLAATPSFSQRPPLSQQQQQQTRLDASQVAGLVRQLAEARLEVRQLRAIVADRDEQLATLAIAAPSSADVAAGDGVSAHGHTTPPDAGATARPSAEPSPSSSSSSSSGRSSSHAGEDDGSGDGPRRGAAAHRRAKQRSPAHHRHRSRRARTGSRRRNGDRAAAEVHQHHSTLDEADGEVKYSASTRRHRGRSGGTGACHRDWSESTAALWKERYYALRLRYDRLRVRHERDLGEIQLLVDSIGLEQERARLRQEHRELLRIADMVDGSGAAGGVGVGQQPAPSTHRHQELERGSRDLKGTSRAPGDTARTSPPRPPPRSAPEVRHDYQQPRLPESLEVTSVSLPAHEGGRPDPPPATTPQPHAVNGTMASTPPQAREPAAAEPLTPSPQQQLEGDLSQAPPSLPSSTTPPPGLSSAAVQQLQQEVALWRGQCLQLLLNSAQSHPPASAARTAAPAAADISIDPLPPAPQRVYRPSPSAAPPLAPGALFVGAPAQTEHSFDNTVGDAGLDGSGGEDLPHSTRSSMHAWFVPDPGSRWRASGNALPPHVYRPDYPPPSTAASAGDVLGHYTAAAREALAQKHRRRQSPHTLGPCDTPRDAARPTDPCAVAGGGPPAPSSSAQGGVTDRGAARAELERDIAKHDQLLAAIAKLQRTAAEETARRPPRNAA